MMTDPIVLHPGHVTLADLEHLFRSESPAHLDPAARPAVEASAMIIAATAGGAAPVYGVNTGFGKLASVRIKPDDARSLQRNLIRSHCCGVGAPVSEAITRLTMILKLISLGRGASGVRWDVIELLQGMLARGVLPVIPSQGSVGASGNWRHLPI